MGIAQLGGLYGVLTTGYWWAAPQLAFLFTQPFAIDYGYSERRQIVRELVKTPSENAWSFVSTTVKVHKKFLDYWNGTLDFKTPLKEQAWTEAEGFRAKRKSLMPIEISQLLTFKKQEDGELTPVLDVVLHFSKYKGVTYQCFGN